MEGSKYNELMREQSMIPRYAPNSGVTQEKLLAVIVTRAAFAVKIVNAFQFGEITQEQKDHLWQLNTKLVPD